jgi:serine/threonine protein kinase
MFPWADRGSLLDVWRSEDSGRRAVWSLEQMLGLADALRILHTLNFRHGDLKPDNILHFTDGVDTLVIADVGVSTIHEAATNARSGATLNQATTKAYEAPDAFIDAYHRKPRSRVYDIWSLGCIYLEFIIWLLYGYDAIDTFNHVRGFPNYSFYQRLGEDKAVVHPDVVKAMKLLFEDPLCKPCTAINDLLKLIEQDLLVVDVKVRVTAEVLYGKLKDIVHPAKEHCLHLRQTTDPSSEIPEMFRPRLHSNPDKEPL